MTKPSDANNGAERTWQVSFGDGEWYDLGPGVKLSFAADDSDYLDVLAMRGPYVAEFEVRYQLSRWQGARLIYWFNRQRGRGRLESLRRAARRVMWAELEWMREHVE